jgi:hypothetical protein
VEIALGNKMMNRLEVTETDKNSGVFKAQYKIPNQTGDDFLTFSYGYFGFETKSILKIQ